MVDKLKTPDDFENMSDEDFLKLNESDYSGNVPEGQTNLTSESTYEELHEKPTDNVDPDNGTDGDESDASESSSNPDGGFREKEAEHLSGNEDGAEPHAGEEKPSTVSE